MDEETSLIIERFQVGDLNLLKDCEDHEVKTRVKDIFKHITLSKIYFDDSFVISLVRRYLDSEDIDESPHDDLRLAIYYVCSSVRKSREILISDKRRIEQESRLMTHQKACVILDLLCILPLTITLKPDLLRTLDDYIRENSTPQIRFMHLCRELHASNSEIPSDLIDKIDQLSLLKDDTISRYQIRLYTFIIERLNSINTTAIQDDRSDHHAYEESKHESSVHIRPVYPFALSPERIVRKAIQLTRVNRDFCSLLEPLLRNFIVYCELLGDDMTDVLNESGILGYLTETKSIDRLEAGKIDKIYYDLGYLILNRLPSRVYSNIPNLNHPNQNAVSNYLYNLKQIIFNRIGSIKTWPELRCVCDFILNLRSIDISHEIISILIRICTADNLYDDEELNRLVENYFTRLASYITNVSVIDNVLSILRSKRRQIADSNEISDREILTNLYNNLSKSLYLIKGNLNHQVPSYAQRTFKDLQCVIKRLGDLLLRLDRSEFNILEDSYPPPKEIMHEDIGYPLTEPFQSLRDVCKQQHNDDYFVKFYNAMIDLTIHKSDDRATMPNLDLASAFSEESLRKSFFTLIQEGTIPFIVRETKSRMKLKFRSLGNTLNALYEKRVVSYLFDDKIENCARGYVFQRIRWVILGNNDDSEVIFSDILKCMNSKIERVIPIIPELNEFLNSRLLIELMEKIDGNQLGKGALENVQGCIYFARIEDTSYGRTVYGGYVLINSIFMPQDEAINCIILITLIHELAHLVTRRTRKSWDIRFNSPPTIKDFPISGSNISQPFNTQENGHLIEQILFGYKPQYVNTHQVNFLLNPNTWILELEEVRRKLLELSMKVGERLTNISKGQAGIFLDDFRCAMHKERTMSMK
jgi:hypothetical protein